MSKTVNNYAQEAQGQVYRQIKSDDTMRLVMDEVYSKLANKKKFRAVCLTAREKAD